MDGMGMDGVSVSAWPWPGMEYSLFGNRNCNGNVVLFTETFNPGNK